MPTPVRHTLAVSGGTLTALYDPDLREIMVTHQPTAGTSTSFWVPAFALHAWVEQILNSAFRDGEAGAPVRARHAERA